MLCVAGLSPDYDRIISALDEQDMKNGHNDYYSFFRLGGSDEATSTVQDGVSPLRERPGLPDDGSVDQNHPQAVMRHYRRRANTVRTKLELALRSLVGEQPVLKATS